jgi:TPR repeat protein
MSYRFAVLLMLFLALPVAAQATVFDDAKAAYARKDYATAHRLLEGLAAKGDDESETALGRLYEGGHGVKKDYAAALHWYRRAAAQGNAAAQACIGLMYRNGEGLARDDAEALRWLLRAGKQGNPEAARALGDYFETGAKNVPQDYKEAFFWQLLADDQRSDYPLFALMHQSYRKLGFFDLVATMAREQEFTPVLEKPAGK